MNSQHVAGTHRPLPGRAAFAHAAAVEPQGARMAIRACFVGSGYRWLDGARVHPGEGGA